MYNIKYIILDNILNWIYIEYILYKYWIYIEYILNKYWINIEYKLIILNIYYIDSKHSICYAYIAFNWMCIDFATLKITYINKKLTIVVKMMQLNF